MHVRFKKELYPEVPNRWYACQNFNDRMIADCVLKFYIGEETNLSDELKNNGFMMLKEERAFGPETHERYYCPYLEFNDPAEEARFIMWASGGIEI